MLHIEISHQAIDAEMAQSWHVVDVAHYQHISDVFKSGSTEAVRFCGRTGDAIGVEVVEEGFDGRIGFRDVHTSGVKLLHLGVVEAGEMWPSSAKDEPVNMNWW
jgi:hypothetical protein